MNQAHAAKRQLDLEIERLSRERDLAKGANDGERVHEVEDQLNQLNDQTHKKEQDVAWFKGELDAARKVHESAVEEASYRARQGNDRIAEFKRAVEEREGEMSRFRGELEELRIAISKHHLEADDAAQRLYRAEDRTVTVAKEANSAASFAVERMKISR